jgi:hypothetical protein
VGHLSVTFLVEASRLRLIYHPWWDLPANCDDEPLDAACTVPPCLQMHGGWRMNFSGVVHSFAQPIRPRRISYAVRLGASCTSRSFFNFFLSSAPAPYADEAVFYAGNDAFPPTPFDVFTLLLDTKCDEGQSWPMLWLPSGDNGEAGAGLEIGKWHRVQMEFDWEECTESDESTTEFPSSVLCFLDGQPMHGAPHTAAGELLPFGPHPSVLRLARDPQVSEAERQRAQSTVRQLRAGFTRLFLFTWLEDPSSEDVPDVAISDLWIE